MEQASREQIAEGVLALEIVTQFLLNQVAHGKIAGAVASGLVELAQQRAIAVHEELRSEISDTAEAIRGQLNAIMPHGDDPS